MRVKSSFRFSTESLPPGQRLSMLTATLDQIFGGRRIVSPFRDGPYRVDLTVHDVGPLAEHYGARVMRQTANVAGVVQRIPEPGPEDTVILYIHEAGRRTISQCGREASVEPGGGLLVSDAEASTYVLPEASRYTMIEVPRQPLMLLAPGLEDALVRPLPPDAGVLRLLLRYVDILEQDDAVTAEELQRAVVTHIYDLCALAIGATRDAAEIAGGRGLRAARLRAVKSDIAGNLVDGDVSAAALAKRQRVTPRYIRKLFESEGTTLSRFVLHKRLALVHRMLLDPRYAHQTIGTIAYHAGFGDVSTFNRAFRRTFGATPSDVRASARS